MRTDFGLLYVANLQEWHIFVIPVWKPQNAPPATRSVGFLLGERIGVKLANPPKMFAVKLVEYEDDLFYLITDAENTQNQMAYILYFL